MGKKQKYDDYYSNGKVEIGRFGNSVFSKIIIQKKKFKGEISNLHLIMMI